MSAPQISEAVKALESGRRREARRLLGQIVQTDPENVDAWWHLAHATEDPAQKAHCLRQVVRLRPEHSEARRLLADLDRRVTPGRSAHTLKRQVIDTVDNGGGLIVEPPRATQAHPSAAAPANSPKRTGWAVAAALAIVILAGIAGVTALVVVFGGRFISGSGEVTIIAPTLPALTLNVRDCRASGTGSASLVFSNQTNVTVDVLQGAAGAEVVLATLPPGGEFAVEVQPGVQIRYAAQTSAEGWSAGGAVIEIPASSTCRVVIE